MEYSDFDQLMKRYLHGQVTEAEKKKIEAWLEVMKHQDNRDLELSPEDEDKIFRQLTANIAGKDDTIPMVPQQPPKPNWPLRIAASFLLVALASAGIWFTSNRSHNADLAEQSVQKVILEDGTLVWLRNESTVTYTDDANDGNRYCELNGEGLFEVAKDPSRPFIIRYGEARFKVLGTSFYIQRAGDSLKLKVLTGKVQMFTETNTNGIGVVANEKGIMHAGTLVKMPMKKAEIAGVSEGTEYNMSFNNKTLEEVLKRVELKFNIQVRWESDAIKTCRITADFTDHSLQSTMSMISEVLSVQYEIDGSRLKVTGNGCH
jgi:transmembrane sensor